jgi:hypothetical protein
VLGYFYDKWAARRSNAEFAQRMGVLLATGLIVGESLFGVVFAGVVAATNKDAPLALIAEYPWVNAVSVIVFAAAVLGLYTWTRGQATETSAA